MNKKLKEKVKEALSSVLPITVIVLLLGIFAVQIPLGTVVLFLLGSTLLVVGMGFFSLGADTSMIPLGEGLGVQMTKTNKLWLIIAASFIMGFFITVAEPDLLVLAKQVPSIGDRVLIMTVAVGVGLFLICAVLRILFKISLSALLFVLYLLLFAISVFVPDSFRPVAFDSGGVTTGPITVPFIMAFGLGIAATRSDKHSQEDSFGLVALCSVGPILAVMLLGILYNPESVDYAKTTIPEPETMQDAAREFAKAMPHYLGEILLALLPIVLVLLIFQIVSRRFKRRALARVAIGMLYTFIGLALFLTGVNVGFIPVGHLIGSELASQSYAWLLVPLGMLIGYFIVKAEPAVHVLTKQVEEVSGGAIPEKAMFTALSAGVSVSLGLSMLRILLHFPLYWLIVPGYAAALILSRMVPKIFVGIAFDSGGVVSGPMTSTFLLPLAIGACESVNPANVLTDAFGVVAMVALTPLIAIQIMGLWSSKRLKRSEETEREALGGELIASAGTPLDEVYTQDDNDIIEYEEENLT